MLCYLRFFTKINGQANFHTAQSFTKNRADFTKKGNSFFFCEISQS